jgi:hypothetical protein
MLFLGGSDACLPARGRESGGFAIDHTRAVIESETAETEKRAESNLRQSSHQERIGFSQGEQQHREARTLQETCELHHAVLPIKHPDIVGEDSSNSVSPRLRKSLVIRDASDWPGFGQEALHESISAKHRAKPGVCTCL